MKFVDDFIIFDIPSDNEIDMNQVDVIVGHTHNTWQANRGVAETRANTIQGKKAEYVIEKYLESNSTSRYISYDAIRQDNYSKHAPFDGLIFKADINQSILQDNIALINKDVLASAGDTGLMSIQTRQILENSGIYTVEIKSSKLQDPRDYKKMEHKNRDDRTEDDYKSLCAYIKGFYDYFVYPHYCRSNSEIIDFYGYSKYILERNQQEYSKQLAKFINVLMLSEFNNACDIYTRVFIDTISNEIILPGYVLKTRFYEEPRIKKMPSEKSQRALYYMYHMINGKPFASIDCDNELWQWNEQEEKNKLFNASGTVCPYCGNIMSLVDVKKYKKYMYVCDNCPPEHKWQELKTIHTTNLI